MRRSGLRGVRGRGARAACRARSARRNRPRACRIGTSSRVIAPQVMGDRGGQEPDDLTLGEQVGKPRGRPGEHRRGRVERGAGRRAARGARPPCASEASRNTTRSLSTRVRAEAVPRGEDRRPALRRSRRDRRPAYLEARALEVDVVQLGAIDEAVALRVADLRAVLPRVPQQPHHLDVLGALARAAPRVTAGRGARRAAPPSGSRRSSPASLRAPG